MNGRLAERLRQMLGRAGAVRVITALGLLGMALILLSGLRTRSEPEAASETQNLSGETALPDADCYRTELEQRLTDWLSRMDGVGSVTVMLTVSGSAEQIYAEEVKETGSGSGIRRESEIVVTKGSSGESALIAETRCPGIAGAAILCTGGNHAAVRERVTAAVSTVLDLPPSRIYVGACT